MKLGDRIKVNKSCDHYYKEGDEGFITFLLEDGSVMAYINGDDWFVGKEGDDFKIIEGANILLDVANILENSSLDPKGLYSQKLKELNKIITDNNFIHSDFRLTILKCLNQK